MKIELPDDHPIAIAIRDLSIERHRILLSVEGYDPTTWEPVPGGLRLEITEWTRHGRCQHGGAKMECTLINPIERHREIAEMLSWPDTSISEPKEGQ